MSIESDNPKNLSEMRQIVHEWIYFRPTIKHNSESLEAVLSNELGELYQAIVSHKSESEISLEVGDVFFSMLAIDNGVGGRFDGDYRFFTRYAESLGTNLAELFKAVHLKNRINYPITFFNEMSPFYDSSDAFSCLRILRNHHANSSEKLDETWHDSDTLRFDLPFTDDWEFNEVFRRFIRLAIPDSRLSWTKLRR